MAPYNPARPSAPQHLDTQDRSKWRSLWRRLCSLMGALLDDDDEVTNPTEHATLNRRNLQ